MNPLNSVHKVDKDLLHSHEMYLMKQIMQIGSQRELVSGPLQRLPLKQLVIPQDYFLETPKNPDSKTHESKLKQISPEGEKKIDKNGELIINKKFLFNHFQLPGRGQSYWTILNDLVPLVQDDEPVNIQRFMEIYGSQLTYTVATDSEIQFLKDNGLINDNQTNVTEIQMVSTRSAYILFGAQVILQGARIIDDYWETLAKEEKFTTHHRVFKYPSKLVLLIQQLKPTLFEKRLEDNEDSTYDQIDSTSFNFDIPYTIVSEQSSKEIRDEYGRNFSIGQHIDAVIPGQSINGSLELSAQFRVPKYHSKNSFLQATQIKGLDTPIGEHNYEKNNPTHMSSSSTAFSGSIPVETKSPSRMLSSLLDSTIKPAVNEKAPSLQTVQKTHSSTLNIKGWKFDSLPVGDEHQLTRHDHSNRGLNYFEKDKLLKRLNYLTPNQIKETEHSHDCLFVNVGLQRVRKIRDSRWTKYWQYKNGLPLGLLNEEKQLEYFKEKYITEILSHEDVVTTVNELTNMEEIRTTKRKANANLIGHSNIKSFKPPYA